MQSLTSRPRVSRETRLLLATAGIAVLALVLLSRLRFPERPVAPNPVQPLLTQIAPRPTFSDLAAEVARVRPRITPWLVPLEAPGPLAANARGRTIGLRIRDDLAVLVDPSGFDATRSVAHDPVTGLTVLRLSDVRPVAPLAVWSPNRLDQPRYVLAAEVAPQAFSLRPVFIGGLLPVESPLWSGEVWSVPDNAPLPPGALLFTDGGELVGLVDEPRNGPTVVPGMLVIQAAGQLVDNPPGPVAESGVQVQALTRPIADATGAAGGVVVTWVDRTGPAAGRLRVGDVIEGAGGQLIAGPEHWDVRASRAPVGKPLPLLVRRGGKVIDVELVPRARPATPTLGLVLRAVPGAGAEVVRVQPGSAAARAGLAPPDLITVVAGIQAPTPSQVTAAYASARPGQPVLVAVTRGDRHQVLTLAR